MSWWTKLDPSKTLRSYFVNRITDELKTKLAEETFEEDEYTYSDCLYDTIDKELHIHIHDNEIVSEICEKNLQRMCSDGAKCELNHYLLPYLWQLYYEEHWMGLHEANMFIEQAFCQPNEDKCSLMIYLSPSERKLIQIDFQTLDAVDYNPDHLLPSGETYPVRRMSTRSYIKMREEEGFFTQWRWYWKDDGRNYEPYEKNPDQMPFQEVLEAKLLGDQFKYLFEMGGFEYTINFEKMLQRNIMTGKARDVRRRPLFVSDVDIGELKFPPPPPRHYDSGQNCFDLPSGWMPLAVSTDYELIPLSTFTDDYRLAKGLFRRTMDEKYHVVSIKRLQNAYTYWKFLSKQKFLEQKSGGAIDERLLFHGTDSWTSVKAICKQNFDWRVCGKNATALGKGSYFAEEASFSNEFTDINPSARFMFLARVLVGRVTKGSASYTRPPRIDPTRPDSDLYDCCVDNPSRPTIFVVFDNDQCYPEYLIEYKKILKNKRSTGSVKTQQRAQTGLTLHGDKVWSGMMTLDRRSSAQKPGTSFRTDFSSLPRPSGTLARNSTKGKYVFNGEVEEKSCNIQ